MSSSALDVKGLREVQKALFAYSDKMGTKITLSSLRQGANLVKKQAQANAPVRTGTLRRGLRVSASKIHKRGNLIGVYMTLRKGKGRQDPKDPFYGRWIEKGWRRGKTNIPGVYFFDRAYEKQKGNAVRMIIKTAHAGGEVVKRRLGLK